MFRPEAENELCVGLDEAAGGQRSRFETTARSSQENHDVGVHQINQTRLWTYNLRGPPTLDQGFPPAIAFYDSNV